MIAAHSLQHPQVGDLYSSMVVFANTEKLAIVNENANILFVNFIITAFPHLFLVIKFSTENSRLSNKNDHFVSPPIILNKYVDVDPHI